MSHSVELEIYTVNKDSDEEYTTKTLEVVFDMEHIRGYWESSITDYILDGKSVDYETLMEHNSGLERKINYEIDHYVNNYEGEDYDPENEPDFFDCE